MGVFVYKGRDNQGYSVEGELEGHSQETIASQLLAKGITPINISEKLVKQNPLENLEKYLPEPKVPIEELVIFCRQMHALSKAGVPIIRSLHGLVASVRCKPLEKALRSVVKELESGIALSVAMNNQGHIFAPIFVNMMRVGENTGNLDEAFIKVAEYLQLEKETKKRIKQATRYPTMVVIAISVALMVINLWVIPAFSKVFEKINMDLPIATKILLATSNFTTEYWWLMLGSVAAAIVGIKYYIKTENGILQWDRIRLKIPLMGGIFERIALSRFSRVFAMLMRSGVPVLQALNVVAGAVGNEYIGFNIKKMQSQIERGETLTQVASNSGMFSPLVLQMIAVGEEAGALEDMLDDVADFYEEEVDYDLKQLGDAIEPILLVFMGGMVLVLALGVFLPMWDMSGMANQ